MKEESEYMQQVRLVAWFRANYKGELIYHCGNGGKRGKAEGLRFKNMGVVAGIPDLFIPSRRLFIEMKVETGGAISKEQHAIMEMLESYGYTCRVCEGFEDAKKTILKIENEARANIREGE